MAIDYRHIVIDHLAHLQYRVQIELSEAVTEMHGRAERQRHLRHIYEAEACSIEAIMRRIQDELQQLIDQLERNDERTDGDGNTQT